MADEVGSGQVAIEPVFTGFRSKVSSEVETSGREGGRTFGQAFRGALVGLGTLIGIDKLKDSFVESIQGAGQLEQSVGGIQAVFKDASATMFDYASNAKNALGLTKNEYNELGTVIGAQLKNGGIAMDQLAPKTNQLISLGGDLSAQFGGSTKGAVEALSSALKGERDPIEKYGVSLNQAKIDAEAAALGFEKVGGSLSAEASQAATLSLIMKQTADAHGAAAREAGTFASRQSTFNAIMKEGKQSIAAAFLPAATSLYGFMNDRLPAAFEKSTARATVFATGLTDFVAKISAFQAGIASGALTPDLVKALGLDPSTGFGKFLGEAIGGIRAFQAAFSAADGDITSSGFAGFMERFGYGTRVALDEARGGFYAFKAAFIAADGDITSSGFPGFMEEVGYRVRLAYDAIKQAVSTGDFSQMGSVWEAFLAVARPAGPILVEVGKAVGDMSTEIGKLIAGALPLLKPLLEGAAGTMQFLADNTGILTAAIIALAAGVVIWRLAQIAGNIAALASVPVAAAQAASNFALAAAIRGQTAATVTDTVATTASTGSRLAAIGSMVATGAAMVAAKAAQLAGAAATGIATAAQWAWNAAMSANPIGIVILAIVALVAGLIWFFTQTELGRQIFQSVFSFIQDTVNNVIRWFTGTLVPTFQRVWSSIQDGLGRVGSFFSDTWSNVVSGVGGFIGNIVRFFVDLPGNIMSALGNLGSFLLNAGQALIQGFIDGISGMVGAIGDAVGGVLDFAKSFFPHSPAKRGPFSGRGYTSFSGQALAKDFAGGIDSEQRAVAAAAQRLMSSASLSVNGGQGSSATAGRDAGAAAAAAAGSIVNFNGPVYGNPDHIVDAMDAKKRRASTRSNLKLITAGG
ncbi:hypothetical protein NG701_17165 [Pseudarthrobacter sp. HLT3-5]|uniref:phage tail protein n=1 Tax=Pseudarthrobacter cellobiosi TaxID=2953654 RepID=UPI00208F4D63|nr:hypothetical protein [Pseudarthrobacter sp. HLT3-5]MCO4276133.1 hypothetical protein [Pseudarthrobacter sp. HLT3-5]